MTIPTQAQIEVAGHRRYVDRDKLWALFVGHYWDSFAKDRDLILSHINSVMMMAEKVPAEPALTAAAQVDRGVQAGKTLTGNLNEVTFGENSKSVLHNQSAAQVREPLQDEPCPELAREMREANARRLANAAIRKLKDEP